MIRTNDRFLLAELIRRDFIQKYKRTSFGIIWSALSPLLLLVTMKLIFGSFFGRNLPHYTTYLFSGLLLFRYFSGSTRASMKIIYSSASIYMKVPVPKLYFLISHSVAELIDFLISLVVFFVFVYYDGISFSFNFFLLLYPIICLYFINLGAGILLGSIFVFFRDIKYIWPIVTRVIMYSSAIFYHPIILPGIIRRVVTCSPLYMCINYFRQLIIDGVVPTTAYHIILLVMTVLCMTIGCFTYRVCREKIPLYV